MDFVQLIDQLTGVGAFLTMAIGAIFTFLGIFIKSLLDNRGAVTVAKINSETTLGAKAMETLTMALEVLQEENRSMKHNVKQLEGHIDILIELILKLVKAASQEDANAAVSDLETFLRSIGRWPR